VQGNQQAKNRRSSRMGPFGKRSELNRLRGIESDYLILSRLRVDYLPSQKWRDGYRVKQGTFICVAFQHDHSNNFPQKPASERNTQKSIGKKLLNAPGWVKITDGKMSVFCPRFRKTMSVLCVFVCPEQMIVDRGILSVDRIPSEILLILSARRSG
jgi:hypothetical protein